MPNAAAIFAKPTMLPAGKSASPAERNGDFGAFLGGLIDAPDNAVKSSVPAVQANAAHKAAPPEATPSAAKKSAPKAAAPENAKGTPHGPAPLPPDQALPAPVQTAGTPPSDVPAGEDADAGGLPGPGDRVQAGAAKDGLLTTDLSDGLDGDAGAEMPVSAGQGTRTEAAAPDGVQPSAVKGKAAAATSTKPASLEAARGAAAAVAPQAGASPGPAEAQAAPAQAAAQLATPAADAPAAKPAAQPDTGASSASPQAGSPPAAQLGHALAALHVGADGSSKLTIRLDPAELGHVRVEITRGQDGASSVSVAVERLETLGRLQADLTHLHLALDRAGVPEQRSLVMHLAPQDQASGAPMGSSSGGQSGASGGQGGQSGGFQSSARTGSFAGSGSSPDQTLAPASRQASYRRIDTGIDITA